MTSIEDFRALLDESYVWPASYPFKFIIKLHQQEEIKEILLEHELSFRESKTGKYLSVSFDINANSSQDIINIYEKISIMKDVIRL